jgi:hypothetical protein
MTRQALKTNKTCTATEKLTIITALLGKDADICVMPNIYFNFRGPLIAKPIRANNSGELLSINLALSPKFERLCSGFLVGGVISSLLRYILTQIRTQKNTIRGTSKHLHKCFNHDIWTPPVVTSL